jgi:DNA-directed RNA polymerase specialized sigma24 family protein
MEKDVFNTDRPLLFSIAYRMLGSASDAEDVLQDAWLRYRSAEQSAIRSPKAFATTIVTRLCLDRLKSPGRRARNTSDRGCPSRCLLPKSRAPTPCCSAPSR